MSSRKSGKSSMLNLVAQSDIVIALDHENNLEVIKNRYGDSGHYNVNDATEIFSEIISRMIFQERMLLFQESVKERLIKNITKTIEMGGGEFLDTIQRTCRTDGS